MFRLRKIDDLIKINLPIFGSFCRAIIQINRQDLHKSVTCRLRVYIHKFRNSVQIRSRSYFETETNKNNYFFFVVIYKSNS